MGEEMEMDAPAEGAMDEEQQPMMDDKDKEDEEDNDDKAETEASADDPEPKDNLEACCCCLCVCSNNFTEDRSCCGCFPIKCGVVTIVLLTWNYWLFMDDYIHWWFTFVVLLLYIPLLLGAAFFVCWFTEDKKSTRTMLVSAHIQIIVSLVLVMAWYLCYFIWIYKRDGFYQGMGNPQDNTYTKSNKKSFLFTFLGETVGLIALYSYFMCVVVSYQEAMHGPEEEKKAEEPKEEKKDDKKEEEPMMEEPAMEEGME